MKRAIGRFSWGQMKLKQKLLLINLLVVGGMLVSLSVFFYARFQRLVYDEYKAGFRHTAIQIADNMGYKIDKINALVNQVAYNEKLQSVMLNSNVSINFLVENYRLFVLPVMEGPLLLNDELRQITIYTLKDLPESGKAVLSFSHIAQEPWAKKVIEEKDLSIHWQYQDGRFFAVKKYVSSYTGESIGLIYAELDQSVLFADIANIDAAVDGVWVNTGNAAHAFSYGSAAEGLSVSLPEDPELDTVLRVGNRDFFLRRPMGDTGLTVDFYLRDTGLQERTRSIGLQIILIAAALMILSSFIIHVVSNHLLKGIQRLKSYMAQVRGGNFSVKVITQGNDEIDDLTEDFNYMMKRINELIQQVYITRMKLQEAEYTVLQAQISPHFLYNVLSLINWKALEAGADEVGQAAVELSKFYRTALSNNRHIITVKEEIQNIAAYIHIQLMMHGSSFDVDFELDEEGEEYRIPKFILQPIVENAIQHGIDKKSDGDGLLIISSQVQGDDIVFRIIDNGPGPDSNGGISAAREPAKSGGYGMYNVHSRLEFLYGAQGGYGLKLNREETRTVVTVRVRDYRTMEDSLGLMNE